MILAAAILPLATIGLPAEPIGRTRCGAGHLSTSLGWQEGAVPSGCEPQARAVTICRPDPGEPRGRAGAR